MRAYITFVILFFAALCAQAQGSFSFDVLQYPNDLDEYFDKQGNTTSKDAVAEFIGYYNSGKFTNNQKIAVIRLTNQMLGMNYQPSPHFENYFNAINGLVVNNLVSKFDNWHKAAEKAFNQGKDECYNFLKVSRNVLYDKTLFTTAGITWTATNLEVDFISKTTPMFVFKNTDLYGITPGDTLEIYNTGGTFDAATSMWYGKGGRTDFTRVGMDGSKVYTQLHNYKLSLSDGNLVADSARFYYVGLLSAPMYGRLLDKAMARSAGDKSVYPQFDSYIKNFNQLSFGRAKYTGGFGMRGDEIICRGDDSTTAALVFYCKNRPVLKVSAKEMIVRNGKIQTQKSSATIYMEKDSIYHPQLEFS